MREYYDLWDDFVSRLSPQGRVKETGAPHDDPRRRHVFLEAPRDAAVRAVGAVRDRLAKWNGVRARCCTRRRRRARIGATSTATTSSSRRVSRRSSARISILQALAQPEAARRPVRHRRRRGGRAAAARARARARRRRPRGVYRPAERGRPRHAPGAVPRGGLSAQERGLRIRDGRSVRGGEGGHHDAPTAAVRSSSCARAKTASSRLPMARASRGRFRRSRQAWRCAPARRAGEAGRREPDVGRDRQAARHRLKPCAGLPSSAWSCSTASATSATSWCSSSFVAIRTRDSGSRRWNDADTRE